MLSVISKTLYHVTPPLGRYLALCVRLVDVCDGAHVRATRSCVRVRPWVRARARTRARTRACVRMCERAACICACVVLESKQNINLYIIIKHVVFEVSRPSSHGASLHCMRSHACAFPRGWFGRVSARLCRFLCMMMFRYSCHDKLWLSICVSIFRNT